MKKPSAKGKRKKSSEEKPPEIALVPDTPYPVYPLNIDYDPNFHPVQFISFCREGKTPSEVCAAWGITKNKLQAWVVNDPKFKEAFRIGQEAFKAFYDDIAKKMMTGKMFFPQARIFEKWMERYADWREDAISPWEEILAEETLEVTFTYKDVGNGSTS